MSIASKLSLLWDESLNTQRRKNAITKMHWPVYVTNAHIAKHARAYVK